ncbi:MAG TPA: hypothetical protein PLZ79_12235 [Burkholderiales bacterium]|nr:hypothetical protein [Burkholderiales bacterium]
MPRRPDIDAAVEHLRKYTARDEWKDFRGAHLDTMLGPLPQHFGLDVEGVFKEIHDLGHFASASAFLDESFFAAEHGPDLVNPIDDYLRRRGWQETPRAREYLQGIRSTLPSLYEIHDVAWGEWIEVRDRLRGGPPVRIDEHMGSQSLQRWDCFVARVVHPRDEEMLTAGVLSLSRPIAEDIEGLFARVRKRTKKELAAVARELGADPTIFGETDSTIMEMADRLCFHGWLKGLLEASRKPLPVLQNTDGEPLLPTRTRLPLQGNAADVARVMDSVAGGWQRPDPTETRWTWAVDSSDEMSMIRGSAWLADDALVIETNSRERMDRALAVLRPSLGALVGAGLTSHEDLTRGLRDSVERRRSSGREQGAERSPDEAAALGEALQRFKDAHYRRTLDEPVPALGNRTPRECAKTRKGRIEVARWIKDIENGELRQAAANGVPPYDVGWMWRELGVGGER